MAEAPDFGSRFIVASVDNRVLHLRIDRGERRNAFTQDMYRAVKRAAIWANGEAELDAVCITGTGEWFGAGGDMAGGGGGPPGGPPGGGGARPTPLPPPPRGRKEL